MACQMRRFTLGKNLGRIKPIHLVDRKPFINYNNGFFLHGHGIGNAKYPYGSFCVVKTTNSNVCGLYDNHNYNYLNIFNRSRFQSRQFSSNNSDNDEHSTTVSTTKSSKSNINTIENTVNSNNNTTSKKESIKTKRKKNNNNKNSPSNTNSSINILNDNHHHKKSNRQYSSRNINTIARPKSNNSGNNEIGLLLNSHSIDSPLHNYSMYLLERRRQKSPKDRFKHLRSNSSSNTTPSKSKSEKKLKTLKTKRKTKNNKNDTNINDINNLDLISPLQSNNPNNTKKDRGSSHHRRSQSAMLFDPTTHNTPIIDNIAKTPQNKSKVVLINNNDSNNNYQQQISPNLIKSKTSKKIKNKNLNNKNDNNDNNNNNDNLMVYKWWVHTYKFNRQYPPEADKDWPLVEWKKPQLNNNQKLQKLGQNLNENQCRYVKNLEYATVWRLLTCVGLVFYFKDNTALVVHAQKSISEKNKNLQSLLTDTNANKTAYYPKLGKNDAITKIYYIAPSTGNANKRIIDELKYLLLTYPNIQNSITLYQGNMFSAGSNGWIWPSG